MPWYCLIILALEHVQFWHPALSEALLNAFNSLILTALECVLFWCLALSEALLNALVQPGNSHMYGFSPVCDRR